MHLSSWFNEIKNQADANALIFLVANKKDKEEEREVATSKGEQFAREKGLHGFFETSAKTGEGVEETFMSAARMLFKMHYREMREKQKTQQQPKNRRLKRGDQPGSSNASGCKC